MSALSLDIAARRVLTCYPSALRGGRLVALGNYRGFSGARLWRLEGPLGAFCLRAWPPGDPSPDRLRFLHRLMAQARASGLECVPSLLATEDGSTWVEEAGRLWELTTWMPGRADYHDRPTLPRLRAACVELARLHRVWAGVGTTTGPCPAVERRLRRVRDWQERIASGWRPVFAAPSPPTPLLRSRGEEGRITSLSPYGGRGGGDEGGDATDPVRPWAERAWRLLPVWVGRVPQLLAPWTGRPLPLQPCLCDIWHEHVLYEGDRVTGLIDFGGVKIDQVAADLARLLGSLAEDDPAGWAAGLEAYAGVRPLAPEEEALARVLDRTGVIVGVMTWLRWLYEEGRSFEDRGAAAGRLAALVRRMERW